MFSKLEGAVTSGMIHLGDRLGLYRALADAERALTSNELAERTGLDERWVREWAYNQAAAKIIVAEPGERFSFTPEAAAVLASPDHEAFGIGMFHRLPQTMEALQLLPDCFRTGVGLDYDSHGPEGAVGIERSFEPWNRAHLLPTVLPTLDGVLPKLRGRRPGRRHRLRRGRRRAAARRGVPRQHGRRLRHLPARPGAGSIAARRRWSWTTRSFHDPREDPLPADHSVDLVTTFDCIHDMTDPQGMMAAIRSSLADDGTWLLVDIKALDTFEENAKRNPMASLMYGVSVMSCMSSALSEPGGAGLGTLGLSPSKAEAMAREAGFTRFRKLPVDHAVNAFYEVGRDSAAHVTVPFHRRAPRPGHRRGERDGQGDGSPVRR